MNFNLNSQRSRPWSRPGLVPAPLTLLVPLIYWGVLSVAAQSSRLMIVILALSLAASLVALFLYRWDKQAAIKSQRRIPERTLHLVAAVGGWPGAWLAQVWQRHKTQKTSFRFVYWMTVLGNSALTAAIYWWSR